MPWCCPAARPSASTPPPACRRRCASSGIGFEVGGYRVPIVPAAILFDLRNGGDKDWGRYPPYRELGYEAVQAAATDFAHRHGRRRHRRADRRAQGRPRLGLDRAATAASPSARWPPSMPIGSVTVGRTRHFWAAPFEIGDEFGGLGYPSPMPDDATKILLKFRDKMRQAMEPAATRPSPSSPPTRC